MSSSSHDPSSAKPTPTKGRPRELLGPGGPLAATSPRYEERAGQLAMADAVERALDEASILVCEAGTGTGKTLAYLVPAMLSGQRVVVSTATKALEEQIAHRDVPLIEKHLGLRPRVAVLKGLSNYLCLRRYGELRSSPEASHPEIRRSLPLVERWARTTRTGDVAELAGVDEGDPIVARVTSSSETRIGSQCPHYEACFVTRARALAAEADIIIVNHHLYFADVAVKLSAGDAASRAGVIPPHDAVIFDEAHQLEDIATDFFGVRISDAHMRSMLADAERSFRGAGLLDRLLSKSDGLGVLEEVKKASEAFFKAIGALGAAEGRTTLPRDAFGGRLEQAYLGLDSALELLEGFAETHATTDAMDVVRRRAAQARTNVSRIADPATNEVGWVEAGKRSISAGASMVDVGPVLAGAVWSRIGGAVLTSATLAATTVGKRSRASEADLDPDESGPRSSTPPGPSFAFVRKRLGLDELRDVAVEELRVDSPFDHQTSVLLYLPSDLPDVADPSFLDHAGARVLELVTASGGGAFVLTTSVKAMRALSASLRRNGNAGHVLVQGEGPKGALLERFRAHGDAVLVATMSFWEGVDVPGRALRLVVIDRIPFAVPTDPVVVARAAALEARGENPFSSYALPQAAITLRQGFGRLLRSTADRGVVAVLDRRLTQKSYGKRLLSSLPDAPRTDRIEVVREFFQPPPADDPAIDVEPVPEPGP